MSYPKDLDEYNERELLQELERRKTLREQGKCDYCGGDGPVACKFPTRHGPASYARQTQLQAEDPDNYRGH